MKFIKYLFLLFLINSPVHSQIKIFDEREHVIEDQSGISFVEQESIGDDFENSSLDSMRNSFRNFDYELLSRFLTNGLKTELPDLKKILDGYSKKFNSKGKVFFKDNVSNGFSTAGTGAYAKFQNTEKEIGTLEIMYSYKGAQPKINEILILENGKVIKEFPLLFGRIKKIKKAIESERKNNHYKAIINSYLELTELSSNLEDYYDNPNNGFSVKSRFYGNLAWYFVLDNKAEEAIKSAEKGLKIWPFNEWIKSNLVLGYVLKNDFEAASLIYTQMCRKHYKGNKKFSDVFIDDLKRLESENLNISNYEEYIKLIEECKSE